MATPGRRRRRARPTVGPSCASSCRRAASRRAMPDSGGKGRGIFVTGTDTGVGKTWVAAALLRGLCAAGWRAVGMKPVAAGIVNGERLNGDVIALKAAGNIEAP